jgi:serine kinase of HPr protein (carbohydrate metabolism regulator)
VSAEAVHATAVVVGAAGVLIRGPSGSGKSSLALTLVDRAEIAGLFAALVADDRVFLAAEDGDVVARVPAAIAGLLEIRGIGPVPVAHQPTAAVRLVVDLVEPAEMERYPVASTVLVEGLELPYLKVPARTAELAARLIARRLGDVPP